MLGKRISGIVLVGILVVAGRAQTTPGVKPAVPATGAKAVGTPAPVPAPKAVPVKGPVAVSPAARNVAASSPTAPAGKVAVNPATPAARNVAAKPAAPAANKATTLAKKPAAHKTALAGSPKKDAGKTAGPLEASAESSADRSELRHVKAGGQRDPFHSVLQTRSIENPDCLTGKKCLSPQQVSLRGVVKTTNGFLAVVVNSQNKTYFLREQDPVLNGKVLRITGDSVVFRQTSIDRAGRTHSTEVVRRIPGTAPAA